MYLIAEDNLSNLSSQQLIEVINIAYNFLVKILNLFANFFLDLKETTW
jgi:hypothetical protein